MKLEKIYEVEQVLDELTNSEKENFEELTNKLLKAICVSVNISLSANLVNLLFNRRISSKQKKFIAACMLRALGRKQEIFWGNQQSNFRIKVFSLFDEVLLDIYPKIGLDVGSKNDEKFSKLQDLEGDLIKNSLNLSKSINNLEDCQQIKAKFMQLIFGNSINIFLIGSFVEEFLIDKQKITSLENKISRASSNIVELEKIANVLGKNERVNAIVFVEDIIASGGTTVEGLRQLNNICGDLLSTRKIKVVASAICGFQDGIDLIESEAKKLPFQAEVFICDLLAEEDQCFSSKSKVFDCDRTRSEAQQIAYNYGYKLVSKMPLGYQGNQLLITFHETCPNNSLPILWAKQSTWKALFSRV
jgi:hypothetical protein